jgi:hypothetical protein
MSAPSSTYRYGPAQGTGSPGLEALRTALGPSSPSGILRQSMRTAWDHPILEATRNELQAEAFRAGIAGRTGTYSQAAERTGFARELSRIAGPKETGALAEHFRRAWGKSAGLPPTF